MLNFLVIYKVSIAVNDFLTAGLSGVLSGASGIQLDTLHVEIIPNSLKENPLSTLKTGICPDPWPSSGSVEGQEHGIVIVFCIPLDHSCIDVS